MTRRPLVLLGWGLVAIVSASSAEGQEEATRVWTGSATVNWFALPDGEDFVNPVVAAQRDRLHLEARYNYEDQDTTSFFGGWIFEGGEEVELGATPILGVLAGRTDGVAPGAILSMSWRCLSVYGEIEYVIDRDDSDDNYYYSWSELACDPLDWLSLGIAVQRTRAVASDLELERGPFVRVGWRRYAAAAYWFSPDSDERYGVFSLGVEF